MTRMMTKEEDMILAETYIIMNSIIVQYFVYTIQHISSDTCSNTYHTSIYIHIQLWYLLSLGSR